MIGFSTLRFFLILILLINSNKYSSSDQGGTSNPETQSSTESTKTETKDSSSSNPSEGQPSGGKDQNDKKRNPSTLDIKKKENADNCNYSYDKNTKIATFEAKEGYGYNLVKQNSDEIWKTDKESEYATKVVTEGDGSGGKNVSVYLANDTIKNFNKSGKDWTERSQSIELNVKDAKSTYDFDCNKDDPSKTNTYTTKHGFQFNLVKQNGTEIWKATDQEEYSNKVEVKTDSSKPKNVTVHLKNGKTKSLIKLDDKWLETPVAVELDIKKTSDTDSFDYNKQGNVVTFTPKLGVLFKLVKQNSDEIWKTDKESEYATKVVIDGNFNNKADLRIYRANATKITFNKPGQNDQWNENTSLKVAILTLDSTGNTKANDATQYKMNEESDGIYKCEFKQGAKFVEFNLNGNSVWKHDKSVYGDCYPSVVVFKVDEVSLKLVVYLLKFVHKDNNWSLVTKVLFEPSTNKLFGLVTSEKEDGSNSSENNPSHFDIIPGSNGEFNLNFKGNAKCVEVKYDGKSFWKLDKNKHNNQFPKSVIFKPGDLFSVVFQDISYVYKFNSTDKKWELKESP